MVRIKNLNRVTSPSGGDTLGIDGPTTRSITVENFKTYAIGGLSARVDLIEDGQAGGLFTATSLTQLNAIAPGYDYAAGRVQGDPGGAGVDGNYQWRLGAATWTRVSALELRIVSNECRIFKNSSNAPLLRGNTIPGARVTGLTPDIVSGALGSYGFTRGYRDPASGQPIYGELLSSDIERAEIIFARIFVETNTANNFGSPGLFKYPKYGGSEATLVYFTQELKIDSNGAIYSGYVNVDPSMNIAGLWAGHPGAGVDLHFTGFQYARSYDANFTINIGDYQGVAL